MQSQETKQHPLRVCKVKNAEQVIKTAYPEGVPFRVPLPRTTLNLGLFGLDKPQVIVKDLHVALKEEFAKRRAEVINSYHRGAYQMGVLIRLASDGGFWTVTSEAPQAEGWTREALDDWFFGDLVYYRLPHKILAIKTSENFTGYSLESDFSSF